LLAAFRRCRVYRFGLQGLNCQFEGARSPPLLSFEIAGGSPGFKATPRLSEQLRWRSYDVRLHSVFVRQYSAHWYSPKKEIEERYIVKKKRRSAVQENPTRAPVMRFAAANAPSVTPVGARPAVVRTTRR